MILIVIVFGLVVAMILTSKFLEHIKPDVSVVGIILFLVYLVSLILLGFGLAVHSAEYNVAIDPIDHCYIPFGGKHILSLWVYFIYFNLSLFILWFKQGRLSPLSLVIFMIGLLLGSVVDVFVGIQLYKHDTSSFEGISCSGGLLCLVPLFGLILAIYRIVIIVRSQIEESQTRHFKNKFLEACNLFLNKKYSVPVWSLIFMLPAFVVITLILILFGQDVNSLVKVFTDTTTWTFSQKMHPPILTHEGHYLCTVAAKGNPNVVKPIRLGSRHGNTIIVNRQLQIANAFEELLSDYVPSIHRFIRKNYDKYGYNLSLKINSSKGSNITYVIMKPLEWFFLVCLYLFCQKPEQKIRKQYA